MASYFRFDQAYIARVERLRGRRDLAMQRLGRLAETRDAGQSWRRLRVGEEGDDYHLDQIFPGPDDSLFIAAEMGNTYRSRDNGATWQALDTGANGSLWSGITTLQKTAACCCWA